MATSPKFLTLPLQDNLVAPPFDSLAPDIQAVWNSAAAGITVSANDFRTFNRTGSFNYQFENTINRQRSSSYPTQFTPRAEPSFTLAAFNSAGSVVESEPNFQLRIATPPAVECVFFFWWRIWDQARVPVSVPLFGFPCKFGLEPGLSPGDLTDDLSGLAGGPASLLATSAGQTFQALIWSVSELQIKFVSGLTQIIA